MFQSSDGSQHLYLIQLLLLFDSPRLHHSIMKQKDLNPRGLSPFALTIFMLYCMQIMNVFFQGSVAHENAKYN